MNDIARLEAENERLTALNRKLVSGDLDIIALCESEQRLEAEIERLRAEERERCAEAILKVHENNWCRPDWWSGGDARKALAEMIRCLPDEAGK